MKVKVENLDNSLAIRLNQEITDQLGVVAGDEIEVIVKGGQVILQPTIPCYTLDELLKGSPKESFELSEEDRAWLNARPVGKELI